MTNFTNCAGCDRPNHCQHGGKCDGPICGPRAGRMTEKAIAGALFDLLGFLTSSETKRKFSAYDEAGPAVDALQEFAAKRGLNLDDPAISSWSALLSAAPAPQPQEPVAAQQQEATIMGYRCWLGKGDEFRVTLKGVPQEDHQYWVPLTRYPAQAPQQEAGQARELPPLPTRTYIDPDGERHEETPMMFTADQMHEYARAAQGVASATVSAPAVPDEREALRKLCDQLDGMKRTMFLRPGTGQHYSYLVHEDVQAYVEEARKALASAPAQPTVPEDVAKDAARYRWLRDHAQAADWEMFGYQDIDKLDATIDAALSQSQEEK